MPTLDPSMKVKVIEEEVAPGSSTHDFTYTGFGTPKFAIILWGQSNVGAGAPRISSSNFGGVGFFDGTNQCATGWASDHNVSTTNTARGSHSSRAVHIPNAAGTAAYVAYTASNITDGIRLTKVSNSYSGSKIVQVILFAGASIKNVHVGNFEVNGSTSAVLNNGGSWRPNYCLTMTIGQGSADVNTTNIMTSFGWAMENINGAGTGTFKAGSYAIVSQDGVATSNVISHYSGTAFTMELTTGGSLYYAIPTGFYLSGANGGINFSEVWPANNKTFYIAMELDTTDTDMMIERMAGNYFQQGSSNITNSSLTSRTDNHAGAVLQVGVTGALGSNITSGTYHCMWGLRWREPSGQHAGIAMVEQDGVTTTSCGGHTMGPWYWRIPLINGGGTGRSWQGSFFDANQGFAMKTDELYTLPTSFYESFTTLAFGIGAREIWAGDEYALLYQGDSGWGRTTIDVYNGSTKLYGDPNIDVEDF